MSSLYQKDFLFFLFLLINQFIILRSFQPPTEDPADIPKKPSTNLISSPLSDFPSFDDEIEEESLEEKEEKNKEGKGEFAETEDESIETQKEDSFLDIPEEQKEKGEEIKQEEEK